MLRSVLFVPAANARAMQKAPGLPADALILDLEDALAPQQKDQGRANVIRFLRENKAKMPVFVRINCLLNDASAALAQADLRAVLPENPAGIVLPKLESAHGLLTYHQMARQILPASARLPRFWAMIETPAAVLALDEICKAGTALNLNGLIAGTNDLGAQLMCTSSKDREGLHVSLGQIVLYARAFRLHVLDGVYNDFTDEAGCTIECTQGKALGFDGKTLIHPAQILLANKAFGPSNTEIKRARAIIRAYSSAKNARKGAIRFEGEMIEHMHLDAARQLLAMIEAETIPAKLPLKSTANKPAIKPARTKSRKPIAARKRKKETSP